MKATELRLGNYVYRQSSKLIVSKSNVYRIENVNIQSALKYNPIPLTEEWLLKFGFVWNESWCSYMQNGYLLEKIGDLLLDRKYGKVINYVHQLQNLYFLLTDKELQLK